MVRVSYREFAPHPALARYVECYWAKSLCPSSDASAFTRVVPDGSADVIIDAHRASAEIIGTMRRPKLIPINSHLELIAVRFRPGGAFPFLAVLVGFAQRPQQH